MPFREIQIFNIYVNIKPYQEKKTFVRKVTVVAENVADRLPYIHVLLFLQDHVHENILISGYHPLAVCDVAPAQPHLLVGLLSSV